MRDDSAKAAEDRESDPRDDAEGLDVDGRRLPVRGTVGRDLGSAPAHPLALLKRGWIFPGGPQGISTGGGVLSLTYMSFRFSGHDFNPGASSLKDKPHGHSATLDRKEPDQNRRSSPAIDSSKTQPSYTWLDSQPKVRYEFTRSAAAVTASRSLVQGSDQPAVTVKR